MNCGLIIAILRARRKGLLHLVAADVPTRLDCLKEACVKCCLNLGTPVVTNGEAEAIGLELIKRVKGAQFVRSKKAACCLLKDGLCSIYAKRPSGCVEYPWYNIDGRLYCDGGCPGIKHDIDERPSVNDIQPFENFLPDTPAFVIRLIKRMCLRA